MNRLHKNSAYRVLNSERWVRWQHQGATRAVHHARFMPPHCQHFPSASARTLSSASVTQLLNSTNSATSTVTATAGTQGANPTYRRPDLVLFVRYMMTKSLDRYSYCHRCPTFTGI